MSSYFLPEESEELLKYDSFWLKLLLAWLIPKLKELPELPAATMPLDTFCE
ncbi:Hypothetical protein EUBELI_01567 [Lachnospira eligens ATCC 27750]|uniref:Uncharacterized protein n=1 Tax=Lachnospira eligens (strain ATCC 27750 / DSM 3376 / VPI C15-48 / C15-B4) TaxID=515620 RepID=C4Z2I4_LACE2|nr:Hypothetical protein EUBELI_01567 [[Eubacterium] eligens ATCC 27750]